MSYGLPVIATDEGGISDIVMNNETGLLVEKRNAMKLAESLEALILNNEKRKIFGEAGKDRFSSFFTLEHFENNFHAILMDSLKKI
jgi:glycosyltransferase involved in cell wall biosynthesis